MPQKKTKITTTDTFSVLKIAAKYVCPRPPIAALEEGRKGRDREDSKGRRGTGKVKGEEGREGDGGGKGREGMGPMPLLGQVYAPERELDRMRDRVGPRVPLNPSHLRKLGDCGYTRTRGFTRRPTRSVPAGRVRVG